jgi:hypothetical protein
MYYAQNLQTQMMWRNESIRHRMSARISMALCMQPTTVRGMRSLPDYLVNRCGGRYLKRCDWAVITPQMIESAGADIREVTSSFCTQGGTSTTRVARSRIGEDSRYPG